MIRWLLLVLAGPVTLLALADAHFWWWWWRRWARELQRREIELSAAISALIAGDRAAARIILESEHARMQGRRLMGPSWWRRWLQR